MSPHYTSLHHLPSVQTWFLGHTACGDWARLQDDYNIKPGADRDHLKDTMSFAKEILGLRESWNPRSYWRLATPGLHLFGVMVDKSVRVFDWEGNLMPARLQYSGLDAVLPLAVFHYL